MHDVRLFGFGVNDLIILGFEQGKYLGVYLKTRKGIERSILFLRIGKNVDVPIREASAFGDSFFKEISVNLLQAHIANVEVFDKVLKFHEIRGLKRLSLLERGNVVLDGETYFYGVWALEKGKQRTYVFNMIKSKKEAHVGRGDLHERHFMRDALLKGGFRFGVEAHKLLLVEVE
jgi:hypothetical protein